MPARSQLKTGFLPLPGSAPVEWRIEPGLTAYPDAVALMEARAGAIRAGTADELVWLVEHPPLYTAGTSARARDLIEPDRFPVFASGRGGEYTYHGPGQRVAYVMLDLKRRREDVRAFVAALEQWIIETLAAFNVRGERREDRVGVWVVRPDRPSLPGGAPAEDKIAAIGIRLRRWVSFHGIAVNVEPDLSHFGGIVPCGIQDHGVTSLVDLGLPVTMADLDAALKAAFERVFGPAAANPAPASGPTSSPASGPASAPDLRQAAG
ncbi:lipoyl(octanoyl) transferase [Aquamicrobium terrae]